MVALQIVAVLQWQWQWQWPKKLEAVEEAGEALKKIFERG